MISVNLQNTIIGICPCILHHAFLTCLECIVLVGSYFLNTNWSQIIMSNFDLCWKNIWSPAKRKKEKPNLHVHIWVARVLGNVIYYYKLWPNKRDGRAGARRRWSGSLSMKLVDDTYMGTRRAGLGPVQWNWARVQLAGYMSYASQLQLCATWRAGHFYYPERIIEKMG